MVQIANTDNASVEDACTVDNSLGADTIELGAGIYPLTRTDAVDTDDNTIGDLDVTSPLTVVGDGAAATTIRSNYMAPGRSFHVLSSGDLDVQSLTITGAQSTTIEGGGILAWAGSSLSLNAARVTGNRAGNGGGIFAYGDLSLEDSQIDDNTAHVESGGGIRAEGPTFSITDSVVDNNHATGMTGFGGGIYLAITSPSGAPTITRSRITNNDSTAYGGAISSGFFGDGTLSIDDSLIEGNVASSPTNSAHGGAIYVSTDNVDISRSVLRDNHALHTTNALGLAGGGAIYADVFVPTIVRLFDSVVADNSAETLDGITQATGGAIYDADGALELHRTTLSGNSLSGPTMAVGKQMGGGIFIGPNEGSLLLVNSTVSGNSAPKTVGTPGQGGGIHVVDTNSAMAFPQTTVTIIGSTIADNVAGDVGGGADPGDDLTLEGMAAAFPQVIARGSIIDGPGGAESCEAGALGALVSAGRNVVVDPACFTASTGSGDLLGTGAQLQPLAANGAAPVGAPGFLSPLETRAIAAGSPAVDRVPVAECTAVIGALTQDGRGSPRPSPAGGACDSGAYELFTVVPPVPGPTSPPAAAGKKCKKKKKKKRGGAKSAKKKKKKCKKKKRKR